MNNRTHDCYKAAAVALAKDLKGPWVIIEEQWTPEGITRKVDGQVVSFHPWKSLYSKPPYLVVPIVREEEHD